MTTTTWTGINGNWTDPTWSNGVPNATLDAVIDGTSTNPDTVTFNTASGAAHSLSMAFATLAMAGGTLTLENSSSLSALNQTGGLLDFAAGGYTGAPLSQSAGTIEIDSGTLLAEGTTDSLAGTVSGAGEFELYSSGTATLQSGLALTVANFTIGDGSALLGGNLSYGGGFTLASPGTLILSGETFTASGSSQLDGVVDGPGTLLVSGTADAYGLSTHNNPTIKDTGLITEDGNVYLAYGSGTDQTTLAIAAGGTWDMLADVEIAESGTATITNAGLFEKTGGTGQGIVLANLSNTGTISVTAGTLVLEGAASSLGGTVNGSAELELYSSGTATLQSGLALTVANFTIGDGSALLGANLSYAGGFTLASPGTLILSGDTFTASGSSQLDGVVDGPGALLVSGTADAYGLSTHGNPTIKDTGLITEDGNVYLAFASGTDQATLAIAAGGTWDMLANVEIAESGTATITNAGLFEKTGGTGDGFVFANVTNTGTVSVTAGTLVLEGAASSLGGTVNGSAELELYSPGTTTLQSGLALTVANFTVGDGSALLRGNLSYAGAFTLASPGTLILSGDTFTASGTSALDGVVDGPGTLLVSGTADAYGLTTHNDPTIKDTGLITEDGNIYLAYASGTDQATLAIAAGGTWDMLANVEIAESGTATITNAGLFEKTGGTGDGFVFANVTNTGTVSVTAGTLIFDGATFTNTGLVDAASGNIIFDPAVNNTNLSAGTLTGGTWEAVAGTLSITGGSITTDAATIILSGSGSELSAGNGSSFTPIEQSLTSVAAGGTLELLNGRNFAATNTITDHGLIELAGGTFSSAGTLSIAAGGQLAGFGTIASAITNAGSIIASGGNLSISGTSFSDTGLVDAASGNIIFASSVTNANLSAGTLTGGTWEAVAGTLDITGGSITTDAATIILSGSGSELSAGNGSSFTPIEQSLTSVAAHDALEILGGRNYTTANAIGDQGLIQIGGGTFSDTGTLAIAAGGTFSGSGTLSAAAIKNSGSLVAAAGSTLVVSGPVTGNGALVAAGTLDLTGVGNVINAKILGPGLLEIGGGSTNIDPGVGGSITKVDLLAGATLTMGLNAAYNGAFTDTATAGTSTLNLGGHKVSVGHASFTGSSGGTALIDGGGTLTNTGTMTLNGAALDGGTKLVNSKLVKETGSLTLGDASSGTASIVNNGGATYDITGAVSLSAASATADTITNAGLFEMTSSGTAVIGAAFTNTGTIEVTSGTLEITAAFTNTGSIIGTEIQSNGTTFITAPSAALFNQYAAAMDASAGSAALAPPPLHAAAAPSLAIPHAA